MRRAPRLDANHNDVADFLRNLGWSVVSTAGVGKGFPDLVAGRDGTFACLIEVKDGAKSPSKRKLTKDEIDFASKWKGPLIVALSGEDAAQQLLALWRGWK